MKQALTAIAATAVAGALCALPTPSYAAVPMTVSPAHPLRMVTTTVDAEGRPHISVRTATDRATAASLEASAGEADQVVKALDVPTGTDPSGTDPYRAQQWDFSTIHVADAWQTSTGAGVTVAVIDTGVDASHADLAGQVLPEIDVINGRTAGTSVDPNGHGTHVAGTIAALTGNGIGVSSIAPDAKILPVRVLAADGSGSMADAATGIVDAVDAGANVINMSLGATTDMTAMRAAIAYAHAKGVVVVAAAGNSREQGSPVSYPAADPYVIAVAATDRNDRVASYSNRGSYVDVAAPGSDVISTYPGGRYASMDGTSMASPHVAAVAALVKAENPAWSPDRIEDAIEGSAVHLGTPGRNADYGYGRVDAAAAVASSGTLIAATPGSSTVTYGSTVTTRFAVQNPASSDAQLCVSVRSAAATCSTGALSWTQRATAPYQVTLTASGSQSTVAYGVRATATVSKAGKTALTVAIGGADRQNVQVQRSSGSKWVTVKTVKATGSKIKVTGLSAGRRYRVVLASSSAFAGVTSNTAQL